MQWWLPNIYTASEICIACVTFDSDGFVKTAAFNPKSVWFLKPTSDVLSFLFNILDHDEGINSKKISLTSLSV